MTVDINQIMLAAINGITAGKVEITDIEYKENKRNIYIQLRNGQKFKVTGWEDIR